VKKPRFLPFWFVGLGVLVLYVAGLLVILAVGKMVPALPHAAELGEASALVGSFLTVISTFFLLYTIYLQQRIRDEQAVEAHWFELLKRWSEYAQERELRDRAADYQHELSKVELSFRIPDSVDHLSEKEGLEKSPLGPFFYHDPGSFLLDLSIGDFLVAMGASHSVYTGVSGHFQPASNGRNDPATIICISRHFSSNQTRRKPVSGQ
jgi:hypothetical protein